MREYTEVRNASFSTKNSKEVPTEDDDALEKEVRAREE